MRRVTLASMSVGPLARPGALDRLARGRVAREDVRPVHDDARDAVAGRPRRDVRDRHLHRRRHADGVAVVLDHEDERQLVDRREVEPLVDVALVGRALAHAGHRHLARLADLGRQRDAHGVQELRRDRRAHRDQVVLVRPVVARHLAAARRRVAGRRVLRRHDVARAHPEGHAGRDRAVERRDPVVPLLERPRDADLGALVALTADDERDPAGPVEDPHPLVDGAGQRDHPVHREEVGVGQADRSAEAVLALGHGHRSSPASSWIRS